LPAPQSAVVQIEQKFFELPKNISWPVVIKPVFGASSAYVKKVDNAAQLSQDIKYINSNIGKFWLASEWVNWNLMVEEFIAGDEVDIDILIQNGIIKYAVLTDNAPTQEPFFVEVAENIPSILPKNRQFALLKMAKQVLTGLGVRNGCIHFEAKICGNQPMPVEINLRMGGGDVYLFSKRVWGVDLVENSIKIALGLKIKVNKSKEPRCYLLGEQFLSDFSGKIVDIKVSPQLAKKKYLEQIYFEKKVGDTFLAPPDGFDSNIGWVVVSGKNYLEAQKNLAQAKKMVSWKIKPVKK
jgi:biotin carboxylase